MRTSKAHFNVKLANNNFTAVLFSVIYRIVSAITRLLPIF